MDSDIEDGTGDPTKAQADQKLFNDIIDEINCTIFTAEEDA